MARRESAYLTILRECGGDITRAVKRCGRRDGLTGVSGDRGCGETLPLDRFIVRVFDDGANALISTYCRKCASKNSVSRKRRGVGRVGHSSPVLAGDPSVLDAVRAVWDAGCACCGTMAAVWMVRPAALRSLLVRPLLCGNCHRAVKGQGWCPHHPPEGATATGTDGKAMDATSAVGRAVTVEEMNTVVPAPAVVAVPDEGAPGGPEQYPGAFGDGEVEAPAEESDALQPLLAPISPEPVVAPEEPVEGEPVAEPNGNGAPVAAPVAAEEFGFPEF